MAHSCPTRTPLMDLRVVALYPRRISALAGKAGIRFRRRKKLEGTLVPCCVKTLNGRSVAVPAYPIPDGTPSPRYRVQVETMRVAVDDRRAVLVLLSAEPEAEKMDPEQILLSPIFDDGHRMIFEFQRARIVVVNRRGDLEMRLVAVHPVLGIIGTKTIYRFNTRLSALAMRCMEYLAGAVELFPVREPPRRMFRISIPEGEADLSFDCEPMSVRSRAPERDEPVWPEPQVTEIAPPDATVDATSSTNTSSDETARSESSVADRPCRREPVTDCD